MRKLVFVAVALAVLVWAATPASAVSLAGLGVERLVKIKDHSALFVPSQTGGPAVPRNLSTPPNIFPGDEQRTIFQATDIFDEGGNSIFDLSSPTELTGVMYDLRVGQVAVVGGAIYIDFVPMGRNPLTAGGATDFDGNALPSFGGVLEVYEGAHNYTADPGGAGLLQSALPPTGAPVPLNLPANAAPNFWVEGQTTGSRDFFPTVTDGTYWLSAQLIDMSYLISIGLVTDPVSTGEPAFAAGTVMREVLFPSTGSGSGFAYANIFGGSAANDLQGDFGGPRVDIAMLFDVNTPRFFNNRLFDTLVYQGPGWWPVDSEDPVVFAIPEPATMCLLGLGFLGLAGARRVRK